MSHNIGFGGSGSTPGNPNNSQYIGFNQGTPAFQPSNAFPNSANSGGEYCQNCGDFGHLLPHCQNPLKIYAQQNVDKNGTVEKSKKKDDERSKDLKKQEKMSNHKSDKKSKNKKKKDKSGTDSSDSDGSNKKSKKKNKKNKKKHNSSSSSSSSSSDSD